MPETQDRNEPPRLKLFIGASSGVGKTYAMLEEARRLAAQGVDIAVGWLEPHMRPLLLGLEAIPPALLQYRGRQLEELDLGAALRRRPAVLIIDELAHSNGVGSKNAQRWHDLKEILDAGIRVFATFSVEELESLKGLLAEGGSATAGGSVPDSVLEWAQEIDLLDPAPVDLLERLRAGKDSPDGDAAKTLELVIRKGRLVRLRELQVEDYSRSRAADSPGSAADCMLVCVGPSPLSSRLVRATHRMATGLKAHWFAVYVEKPARARMGQADRDVLSRNLDLAQALGAEVATLGGERLGAEILEFARRRNVTKIVVGKPGRRPWRRVFSRSLVHQLTRSSGDIDVYVISGEDAERQPGPQAAPGGRRWSPLPYFLALLTVLASSALSFALSPFLDLSSLIMVYLLGVVALAAARGERGPSALAAVLSVLAFDFFFVPLQFSFAVTDAQYLFTLAVMLLAGLLISGLTVRLRRQAEWARQREGAAAALYAMSRTLSTTHGLENILQESAQRLATVFEAKVVLFLRNGGGSLVLQDLGPLAFPLGDQERALAQRAFDRNERAGLGTAIENSGPALYQPLCAPGGTVGVIGLRPTAPGRALDPGRLHLLETFTNHVAVAIEATRLATRARSVEMEVETERLRNSLLSSVSHDLRTPLASIMGSSSTLLDRGPLLSEDMGRDLIETIYDEAERLNRLVGNLLDATRLEAKAMVLRREWQPLEEIVGVALGRLSRSLSDHPLATKLPPELPLVHVDATLLAQALFNLVDNATHHTPPGTAIELRAEADCSEVIVSVADSGPGIPAGQEERVFEKFYRGPPGTIGGGSGLGLTISRGIIVAHGGRIWVEKRVGGGAVFRFALPRVGTPPSMPPDHKFM